MCRFPREIVNSVLAEAPRAVLIPVVPVRMIPLQAKLTSGMFATENQGEVTVGQAGVPQSKAEWGSSPGSRHFNVLRASARIVVHRPNVYGLLPYAEGAKSGIAFTGRYEPGRSSCHGPASQAYGTPAAASNFSDPAHVLMSVKSPSGRTYKVFLLEGLYQCEESVFWVSIDPPLPTSPPVNPDELEIYMTAYAWTSSLPQERGKACYNVSSSSSSETIASAQSNCSGLTRPVLFQYNTNTSSPYQLFAPFFPDPASLHYTFMLDVREHCVPCRFPVFHRFFLGGDQLSPLAQCVCVFAAWFAWPGLADVVRLFLRACVCWPWPLASFPCVRAAGVAQWGQCSL